MKIVDDNNVDVINQSLAAALMMVCGGATLLMGVCHQRFLSLLIIDQPPTILYIALVLEL